MENGNGKWKWKMETEMRTKKPYQSLVQCFIYSVLSHYSSIVLSNCYGTGFMSHVLPLLLYCALWLLLLVWLVSAHVASSGNTVSIPTLAALFLDPLSVRLLAVCESKIWLHAQALGTIAPSPTIVPPQILSNAEILIQTFHLMYIQNQLVTEHSR